MSKGYDPKCEELARYFMPGSQSVAGLAQAIQDAVEDYLSGEPDTEAHLGDWTEGDGTPDHRYGGGL